MTEHFRWIATVTYRGENGPIKVEHHFEELAELDAIVERGPDWNTIIEIRVLLNPNCSYPDDTVEAAEER